MLKQAQNHEKIIMQEWNTVIIVYEHGFEMACQILGDFGKVKRSDIFNTLIMKVDDVEQMLETLRSRSLEGPDAIVAVETISNWVGLSLWTRDQLQRYPFIQLD